MKQVFTIGNKRSGTSLLVRLLNLHPALFITHESDIIWILFQSRRRIPRTYRPYPWDGPLGMRATLQACLPVLRRYLGRFRTWPLKDRQQALVETYYAVQYHLLQHGTPFQPAYDKPELVWIGDKKPVQQGDPEIHAFLNDLFPEARYVHIVRHPQAVTASMQKAASKWPVVPPYWTQDESQILERWAIQEEWALRIKARPEISVYTLRHEDLSRDPVAQMKHLLAFLDLDLPGELADQIRQMVQPNQNRKHQGHTIAYPEPVARLMDTYGYKPDGGIRD